MKKLLRKISNVPLLRKTIDFFKKPKVRKFFSVLNKIKNVICWTLFVLLVVAVIALVATRVKGNTPSIFGYSLYRVSSGSMEPELMVGDIILNKSVDDIDTIKVNDIITYIGSGETAGMLVTHKVIVAPHTNEDGLVVLQTQGVANDIADPEITSDRVVGVLVGTVPFLSYLYNLFLSMWGLIIFIVLLLVIFLDELINLIKALAGYTPKEDREDISEIIDRLKREELDEKKLESEHRLSAPEESAGGDTDQNE